MDTGGSGGGPLRTWWRLLRAGATGCAFAGLVAGCVSQEVADAANQRLNFGMTTSELQIANRAALRQARVEGARVTARATVTEAAVSASPDTDPRPCTSGRLLHITLVGRFPHAPASAGSGTTPVTGQDLTVDATTGRLCDAHYVTGPVLVDPTSVLLFSA